jgi:hypothetical protein
MDDNFFIISQVMPEHENKDGQDNIREDKDWIINEVLKIKSPI